MAEITVKVSARLRRGAMPFLFFVNAIRKLAGFAMWVPGWLIVTEIRTQAGAQLVMGKKR
jgi:hypothetical protein